MRSRKLQYIRGDSLNTRYETDRKCHCCSFIALLPDDIVCCIAVLQSIASNDYGHLYFKKAQILKSAGCGSRSDRARSSVKAPPPARSRRFSNKEMFGLSCAQDELFYWSLRPEKTTRGFTPPPKSETSLAPAGFSFPDTISTILQLQSRPQSSEPGSANFGLSFLCISKRASAVNDPAAKILTHGKGLAFKSTFQHVSGKWLKLLYTDSVAQQRRTHGLIYPCV